MYLNSEFHISVIESDRDATDIKSYIYSENPECVTELMNMALMVFICILANKICYVKKTNILTGNTENGNTENISDICKTVSKSGFSNFINLSNFSDVSIYN